MGDWIRELRSQSSLQSTICIVKDRASSACDSDRRFILNELVWLLREAERDDEALEVLDEVMRRYSDDVRCAMSKANICLYSLDRPEEALKWIDVALERAYRTKCWRREALGQKARILLMLGRGSELSDVLEDIMSLQIVRGVPDIGRERDFVDGAPPGFIRKNVLERYNEFRPKRACDGSPDELPPFKPANDMM